MINIPTELLRSFVAVVDAESFTRAAQALGFTQPAVSAHVKRLQALLDMELLDKRGQGVTLTEAGKDVIIYARRLLSLNDQILQLTGPAQTRPVVRLGMNIEFLNPYFPQALAKFRARYGLRFQVVAGHNDPLLRALRHGELDIAVLVVSSKAGQDARHHWLEDMVWARGERPIVRPDAPVPIISRGPDWGHHKDAVAALEKSGRSYEIVFTAPSQLSVSIAAKAGLGVAPMVRSRMIASELQECDEEALPKLPEITCAIYISEIGDTQIMAEMADEIARALHRGVLAPDIPRG